MATFEFSGKDIEDGILSAIGKLRTKKKEEIDVIFDAKLKGLKEEKNFLKETMGQIDEVSVE